MQILQLIQTIIIVACIILGVMIFNWFNKRYSVCGSKDILCYVTGEKTTAVNILQYI